MLLDGLAKSRLITSDCNSASISGLKYDNLAGYDHLRTSLGKSNCFY